jgi:hypothetical protein
MVSQPIRTPPEPVAAEATATAPAGQFLPREPQPWSLAAFLVGIPGATVCAVVTTGAVLYTMHGDAFVAFAAWAGVVGTWAAAMAFLWLSAE